MEKKYYDIIVSIVKQNDKYAGCEPILDDIVQDVYDHSKVVLGSVTNEDVINAYLNKVVATSLITVPKKLNFNTRNKHRIISNVEAITNISIPTKPVEPQIEEVQLESFEPANKMEDLTFEEEPIVETIEESVEIKAEPEFELQTNDSETTLEIQNDLIEEPVDEFKIEESVETSFELEETVNEPEETADIEEIPQETEIIEESEDITTFNIVEDNSSDDFSTTLPEESELLLETPEQDVDKTLVDKMINGVEPEPAETEELSLMEEPVALEEENNSNDEEIAETESSDTFEPLDTFEIEEVTLQEDTDDADAEQDETTEEFSFIDEPVLLQEEESETLQEEDSLELTLEENNELELKESSEIFDTTEQNEFLSIEPNKEPVVIEEEEEEIVTNNCELPNFECFGYEPEAPEFDEEEICADLKELDSKHPEKKLLQVCKLKYEEKQTVSEIAQALELTEETVLDTLNDIIELVKD